MKLAIGLALVALTSTVALAEEGPSIGAPDAGALCDQLAGHPDDVDLPKDNLGVYLDGIDVARAEPACRQAMAEHPEERRYRFELGRVIRKRGDDYPLSIWFYEEAGAQGSIAALLGLGLFYEDGDGVDQDYDKAAGYYQRAIDAGSPVAYRYLAALYEYGDLGAGPDPARAFDLYSRGVAAGDDGANNKIGVLYEDGRGVAQDDAMAETMFRKAIASSDRDARAEGYNNLAWLWGRRSRNLAEAEEYARHAIENVLPGDNNGKASYMDTLAWLQHLLGRDNEAVETELAVLELGGDYAPYYDRLGDMYWAAGNSAKAKAAWQKALDLDVPDKIAEPDFDPDRIREKLRGAS